MALACLKRFIAGPRDFLQLLRRLEVLLVFVLSWLGQRKKENLKQLLILGILVMRLMTKVCSLFILTAFTFNDNE